MRIDFISTNALKHFIGGLKEESELLSYDQTRQHPGFVATMKVEYGFIF
jgi:hypothetical protein